MVSVGSSFAATTHPQKLSCCTWCSIAPVVEALVSVNENLARVSFPLCVAASLLGHLKRSVLASITPRLTFDELTWNAVSPLIKATVNDTQHVMQFLGHSGEVSVYP